MTERFAVTAESGTLRAAGADWVLPHRWSAEGVGVHAAFTGAHLLHLAVGGCLLNDVHREAEALGLTVDGVRVRVSGGFDAEWRSTGVEYTIEVDSEEDGATVVRLVERVEAVAEIPRSIQQGIVVRRV